jgi:hypothetical protein
MNVVRTQGQLETVEVWPGGPRTRINRHDLVRKLVVRPLRLEKHQLPLALRSFLDSDKTVSFASH